MRNDHLSVASMYAGAVDVVTFHEDGFQGLYGERLEIYVPDPDKEDRENYNLAADDDWDNSDGACAYRDSYFPMMNHIWPVELAYGVSPASAADAMRDAGSVVLISIGEAGLGETAYFIAMTGGGTDLSDSLVKGYLACGCIPPIHLLERMDQSHLTFTPKQSRLVRRAIREAASYMRSHIARLGETAKGMLRRERDTKARRGWAKENA